MFYKRVLEMSKKLLGVFMSFGLTLNVSELADALRED